MTRPLSWRDRYGDTATCVRCLEEKDINDLDRLFWCRECRARARERAKRGGWIAGAVAAGLLALWIWIWVRPSTLILGGWIASVVAAFWLIARIGREVHYGAARFRSRRAVDAMPPAAPPPSSDSESEESPWEEGR